MRKAMRRVCNGLLVLLAIAGMLWALARWMGPSEEQKEALAILARKDIPVGRNAFPAMWLLPYDVPEEQLEAVAAEDAANFHRLPKYDPRDLDPPDMGSVAEDRFGRVVGVGPDAMRCSLREPGCLAKVRADPAAYAQWRKDNARLFERAQAVSHYDYYRNPFPARVDLVLPPFQYYGVLPTMRALDFANGRREFAVEGVCRDMAMWRNLSKGTDTLILRMIAIAGIRGSSSLLAEMLQELPSDFPLPAACMTAVAAPVGEEIGLCGSMRGEAAWTRSVTGAVGASGRMSESWFVDALMPVLYDGKGTESMMAPAYAWPCSQEAMDAITEDRPLEIPQHRRSVVRIECAGNPVGCFLADAGAGAYDKYLQRSQDSGAQLRLIGTLLWLHRHAGDGRPLAERLASRPEDLKSQTRDIEVVNGGKALSIRMFDDSRGETFELPLPAYLQDAALTN